jgi:hypothetical protein
MSLPLVAGCVDARSLAGKQDISLAQSQGNKAPLSL